MDEFTKVIGCYSKAAIRLLRRGNQPMSNKKRGRPRQYGATVVGALRVVWEATDRLCSKCLHSFLPELAKVLRRHGNSTVMKLVTKTRHGAKVHKVYLPLFIPVFHSLGTRWHWGVVGCDMLRASPICNYHTGIYSFLVPS